MNRILSVAAAVIAVSCVPENMPEQGLEDDKCSGAKVEERFDFPEYARYFELPFELSRDQRMSEVTGGFSDGTDAGTVAVNVSEGGSSWLRAEVRVSGETGAVLCIQMKENTCSVSRSATISVKDSISVRIIQSGAEDTGSLRKGLTALYHALDGKEWAVRTGWGTDRPVMEWYGVKPSRTVIADLFGREERVYEGTSDAWSLVLDGNNLRGVVPQAFWDACRHFEEISLSGANLEGSILSDQIWHEGLRKLCFSDTGIGGVLSEEIAAASKLEVIDLQNCNLTGTLPDGITSLRSLRILNLGANSISGTLPDRIGELSELEELRVGANFELCGTLPESFHDLSALRWFSVGCTKVGGPISHEIGRMRKLRYFCISFCEFIGTIPEELGTIPGIGISCEGNYFTRLPEFIRYRGFQNEWVVVGGVTPDWVPFYQRDTRDGRPDDLFSIGKHGIVYNYGCCHLLPLPVWAHLRYGLLRWDMFHSYEDIKVPAYPVAEDLEFPADEYFYDGTDWRHPALEFPAKEYFFDGKSWVHDASCPWDKEY